MKTSIQRAALRLVTRPFLSRIIDANAEQITNELSAAMLKDCPSKLLSEWNQLIKVKNGGGSINDIVEIIISSQEFRKAFLGTIAPNLVDQMYESFLKRPSDVAGNAHYAAILTDTARIDAVLNAFIVSSEFRGTLDLTLPFMELSIPKSINEYLASDDQLRAIADKIKASWEHLGRTRAHHSVLTSESFLPDELNKNISSFWKSGYQELSLIEKILVRHGKKLKKETVAVEYGCGVGRITAPLAKHVESLHAYDISSPHLNYAKEHMQEEMVTNVAFHLVSDPLASLQKCDFFYSRIVFQHNPPPIIYQLFKNSLSSLNPGGVAIIQVPVYIRGHSFVITDWLAKDHLLDMQMHCLPQEAIFTMIEEMKCNLLEVREDNSCGDPSHYLSNTFVIVKRT